ncbi:hypothetical protein MRV_0099 [Murid herpesvirus 3]|uniref:Uncharacterized protein n=2 Tax=Murid betaherpesvirus 3 TaxID=2560603 RepID=A0A1P8VIY0_9BETA|nr:hypothetical protein MRV_0099 [Murine roseolovirus]APZ76310.1 hypothetical protein MRV_0099 [Murid betaherpesvirus 3]AYH64784.1 hypothetical protein MRV_0099 [Murid herpesvirus 3]
MATNTRCYINFVNPVQTFHQSVNNHYQLKRFDFLSASIINISDGSITNDKFDNGWISILSCSSEQDNGVLIMDIIGPNDRLKVFTVKGAVQASKNSFSAVEKADPANGHKEQILSITCEQQKLSLIYYGIDNASKNEDFNTEDYKKNDEKRRHKDGVHKDSHKDSHKDTHKDSHKDRKKRKSEDKFDDKYEKDRREHRKEDKREDKREDRSEKSSDNSLGK